MKNWLSLMLTNLKKRIWLIVMRRDLIQVNGGLWLSLVLSILVSVFTACYTQRYKFIICSGSPLVSSSILELLCITLINTVWINRNMLKNKNSLKKLRWELKQHFLMLFKTPELTLMSNLKNKRKLFLRKKQLNLNLVEIPMQWLSKL